MKSASKESSTNSKLLCFVMSIWCIALLLTGLLMISKNREEREVVQKPNVVALEKPIVSTIEHSQEVKGVEVDSEYSIQFCYMDFCKQLESKRFLEMVENGKISSNLLNIWIHTDLEKYFLPLYSKQELVKNSKGEYLSRVSEYIPNYSAIYEMLNDRYVAGEYDIKINIPSIMTASTDGKFAYKYIEVDNTQQKLYVWIDGVVIKEIFLSGAREDSSVKGVFNIVDKGLQPIAPGDKYMPYWMAFYYEPSKSTWYGLHGLIWIPKSDGSRWIEPVSNIGRRISGGCIRMKVEDAKYLYGIFEKGEYVLVHD